MPKAASATISRKSVSRPRPWTSANRWQRRPHAVTRAFHQPTILWVDDFEPGLAMYRAMFERLGFRVLTASSGQAAIRVASENHLDLVVTDYEMPEINGDGVALAIKAINPSLPIILFSGSTLVPELSRRLFDAQCDKASSREHLLEAIHFLLGRKRPAFLQPPPSAKPSDLGQRTVA